MLGALAISGAIALWALAGVTRAVAQPPDSNPGTPFAAILDQLDLVLDWLDELESKIGDQPLDLRGVVQNWDKKLDATNGESDGCNSDRFTCVLDGLAVRDNETGLVWVRNPDGGGSWSNIHAYCNTLEIAGRRGWRVPFIQQFTSLFADSGGLPVGHPFVVTGTNYLSATTPVDHPAGVWAVVPATGFVFVNDSFKSGPGAGAFAWCVRGGQSFDGHALVAD